MLNRLSTEFGIKEKNLTIGKQGVEIRSKKQQLVFVILLLFLTLIFIAGLIRFIVKSRNFREQLFKKEKYLDQQIAEMTSRILANTKTDENAKTSDIRSDETAENLENMAEFSSEFKLYTRFLDDMKKELKRKERESTMN